MTYVEPPVYERKAKDEAAANRTRCNRTAFDRGCDAFAALTAKRYFAPSMAAIKAADANHLVLGCRFAYPPWLGVVEAARRRSEVKSFNCYDRDPGPAIEIYSADGGPRLIGEFSFRAADSGLPNTNGTGPMVANQAERAEGFHPCVIAAQQQPCVVGYHWFEHADQPAEGRFDGENSNAE